MARIRASLSVGGGGEIDFGSAPDVIWQNASMSNNATQNIAVTQKPRYVMIALGPQTSSTGSMMFGILNVETESAYRYACWGTPLSWNNGVWASSTWSQYITSITSSSVTVKNAWGGAAAVAVGIYY